MQSSGGKDEDCMDMTRTDVRTPPGQGILTVLWPCSDAAQNTSAQADRSSGAGNILLFMPHVRQKSDIEDGVAAMYPQYTPDWATTSG
eukprot:5125961-Pleurochrysis_carterae.AAC.4